MTAQPVPSEKSLEDVINQEKRDGVRYELVDGQAVAMVGGSRAHDLITISVFDTLLQQLKDPCQPVSSNMKVKIPNGNYRYPDASVDCTPIDPNAQFITSPIMVVEVLSQSTAFFDATTKLDEYKTIESLRYIMLVNQDKIFVQLHVAEDSWQWQSFPQVFQKPDDVINLPQLHVTLTIKQIYARLPALIK